MLEEAKCEGAGGHRRWHSLRPEAGRQAHEEEAKEEEEKASEVFLQLLVGVLVLPEEYASSGFFLGDDFFLIQRVAWFVLVLHTFST